MPNFDALRSAIIGPLEYICRPKVKPAELLALFPMNGDMADLSSYARTMAISTTPVYTTDGPLGKCAAFKGSFVHTATTPFTIDFFANFPPSGAGNGNFFPNSSIQGSAGNSGGGIYGVTSNGRNFLVQMTNTNEFIGGAPGTFSHFALTYNGSTFCVYLDGLRKVSKTIALNAQSSIHLVAGNTKYCNLRVIGKCLTTGDTFPVPQALYTGYEAI